MNKVAVSTVVGKVTKAPTKNAVGSLKVTVTAPTGLTAAAGTVAVTVTKGATTKTLNASVVNGVATLVLPKLASGSRTISVAYQGDSNYSARTVTASSLKVK